MPILLGRGDLAMPADNQQTLRAKATPASRPSGAHRLQVPPLTAADVLHAREVAEFLRVPLSTVMQWAREDQIPAHKRGRRWLFLRPEIEEWLRAPDQRR